MSSAAASSSSDPYAPFYYWDAAAYNWAFDYNGYYATYGYPQQGSAGGASSSAYPASSAAAAPTNNIFTSAAPATTSSSAAAGGAAQTVEEKRRKAITGGARDAQGNALAGSLKRGEHRTTVIRKGPNGDYEDPTLLEWDPAHKRLFVGDLGNDVTDGLLTSAFQKYPSFVKARVIRKKLDGKARGYGFVSFSNPEDYLRAWKEMNGRYIGSRPVRLKAAESSVEAKDIGYRQDRKLAENVKHEAFKAKYQMGGAVGGSLRRHGVGKAWASK